MQQGPSSTSRTSSTLGELVKQFAPLIRAAGAEAGAVPGLAQPPRHGALRARGPVLPRRCDSVGALYALAGNAWHRLLDTDYALGAELYEVDAFHPTPMGTYLAAVVIAARIRGMMPDHLPPVAPGLTLEAGTVRSLQRAAQWALDHSPAHP